MLCCAVDLSPVTQRRAPSPQSTGFSKFAGESNNLILPAVNRVTARVGGCDLAHGDVVQALWRAARWFVLPSFPQWLGFHLLTCLVELSADHNFPQLGSLCETFWCTPVNHMCHPHVIFHPCSNSSPSRGEKGRREGERRTQHALNT